MDETQKFVSELNISRFLDWLAADQEPAQRALRTRLLIAEEDRFGSAAEKLDMVEHCLESCASRIMAQRLRLEGMPPDHPQRAPAERLLMNMIETRSCVRHRRDCLRKALES